eukprot:XP_011668427.1 PREDICTED: multiple epidermal growth factor-like domains protein 10 [Strongylocentrotus purpuratus]
MDGSILNSCTESGEWRYPVPVCGGPCIVPPDPRDGWWQNGNEYQRGTSVPHNTRLQLTCHWRFDERRSSVKCNDGVWSDSDQVHRLCRGTCPDQRWGSNCLNLCGCSNGASCDPMDGSCTCQAGFSDLPGASLYLTACLIRILKEKEETERPSLTWFHVHMTAGSRDRPSPKPLQSGTCHDYCPEGTYGPNCANQCQCQNNGVCNPATGKCTCKPGWKGEVCAVPCRRGRYGQDCRSRCTCFNCASCNPVNGTCQCPEGFQGDQCELQCLSGTYGVNCNLQCQCQNDGRCSSVDGSCSCQEGFIGKYCGESAIQCRRLETPPHALTGPCSPPYSTGKMCTYSCMAGYMKIGGDDSRVCDVHGEWIGTPIRCERDSGTRAPSSCNPDLAFLEEPHNLEAAEGDLLEPKCRVSDQDATLTWFKDRQTLDSGAVNGIFVDQYNQLIIPSFNARHAGLYSCVVFSGDRECIRSEANISKSLVLKYRYDRMIALE